MGAYGLGLEAMWNQGNPSPIITCGMEVYGHAGEDYGSGAPLAGYLPALRLGVTFAITSAGLESGPLGMNSTLRYEALAKAPEMAMNDLLNTVMAEAVGIEPACPVSSYDMPEDCDDAPSMGRVDYLFPLTCAHFVESAVKSGTSATTLCDDFLGRLTIYQMQHSWAPSAHLIYSPPHGHDVNNTRMVDLCKGTCGGVGSGACWMKGVRRPWSTSRGRVTDLAEVGQARASVGRILPTRYASHGPSLDFELQFPVQQAFVV